MAPKKKVLFLITKSNWGGAQKYVHDLAIHLPADRFDVVVAFGPAPDGGHGILGARLADKGVRTVLIPELVRNVGMTSDAAALRALIRTFHDERPHIVHLNSSKAAGLGALAARIAGIPNIVYTAHGWPFLEERPVWQKILIELFSFVTSLLAHSIITISKKDFDLARRWPLMSDKVHLIHNGIHPTRTVDRTIARFRLREYVSARIPATGPLIGTIAELHRNKGVEFLIRALTRVTHAHLAIAGSGEEYERLTELAASLRVSDRVTFLGFVPDAAESILPALDAFILASIKEGSPFVLLEAGVRGVPVIASNVGGIPDIIIDSHTGLLVPAKNIEALAAAIETTLSNPKEAEARASALKAHIGKSYDFETITLQQTLKLYS